MKLLLYCYLYILYCISESFILIDSNMSLSIEPMPGLAPMPEPMPEPMPGLASIPEPLLTSASASTSATTSTSKKRYRDDMKTLEKRSINTRNKFVIVVNDSITLSIWEAVSNGLYVINSNLKDQKDSSVIFPITPRPYEIATDILYGLAYRRDHGTICYHNEHKLYFGLICDKYAVDIDIFLAHGIDTDTPRIRTFTGGYIRNGYINSSPDYIFRSKHPKERCKHFSLAIINNRYNLIVSPTKNTSYLPVKKTYNFYLRTYDVICSESKKPVLSVFDKIESSTSIEPKTSVSSAFHHPAIPSPEEVETRVHDGSTANGSTADVAIASRLMDHVITKRVRTVDSPSASEPTVPNISSYDMIPFSLNDTNIKQKYTYMTEFIRINETFLESIQKLKYMIQRDSVTAESFVHINEQIALVETSLGRARADISALEALILQQLRESWSHSK